MITTVTHTPFFGFVEDIMDPMEIGRVRVRVVGYNSSNTGELPTSALHWFSVGNDPRGACVSGVGQSPTGLLVGTLVSGHYIDADKQQGVITNAFTGEGDPSSGAPAAEKKNSGLASGVPASRGGSWSQPASPYAPTYPNNRVLVTKSGHTVEYDDTPGAERISIFHKSGTFEEIHPDGTRVIRDIGSSYTINTKDKFIYVDGDFDTYIGGDYRLNVGGEGYLKFGGGLTVDTTTMTVLGISEANDHISSNVSGAYHVHSGVTPGNGVSATPVGASTAFAPTPANTFALETEDTGLTPEVIAKGLTEGFLTPEDVVIAQTYEPTVVTVDETPPVEQPAEIVECSNAILDNGKIDYNAMIAEGVTLRSVSLGAVVSQYAIVAQNGLSQSDIICNLKNIAENVLVPLKKQFPNAMVTSGYRTGSGRSQHLRGEAVDIQFRSASKTQYYQIAQWIKANLPYDQLILEYKNYGSGMPWIHISLKRGTTQRYQIMTFFNNARRANGLQDMS